jgi:ParB family transcriptional regulator, chromosome partitioning protein
VVFEHSDLETAVESMKNVAWTAIAELKKDENLLKKIDEASTLLATLRKTLSS